jgi:hypothetical protein
MAPKRTAPIGFFTFLPGIWNPSYRRSAIDVDSRRLIVDLPTYAESHFDALPPMYGRNVFSYSPSIQNKIKYNALCCTIRNLKPVWQNDCLNVKLHRLIVEYHWFTTLLPVFQVFLCNRTCSILLYATPSARIICDSMTFLESDH